MENRGIPKGLFSLALWLAGIGHFVVLCASVQVPSRLGWKSEFAKLSTFNRKVFYTYAGYIFGMIFCFGLLTVFLHEEMLRGDRAALALALLIGVFWLARLLIDFVYFGHADWPKGRLFQIGHFLLTFLFICLTSTYLGLLIWHGAR